MASSLGVTLIEVLRNLTGGYGKPFLMAVVLVLVTIALIGLAFSKARAQEK